jgi:hypothetical protein
MLADAQKKLGATEQQLQTAEAKLAQSRQELEQFAQVRDMARGTVITLSGGVLFDTGKAELLPGAQDRLGRVADYLKNSPRSVIVEGYTDSTGSSSTNLRLSERRAESVRDFSSLRASPPTASQPREATAPGGEQRQLLRTGDEPAGGDRPPEASRARPGDQRTMICSPCSEIPGHPGRPGWGYQVPRTCSPSGRDRSVWHGLEEASAANSRRRTWSSAADHPARTGNRTAGLLRRPSSSWSVNVSQAPPGRAP